MKLKAGSKRGKKEYFTPRIYNCSIPRDHYGVDFGSPHEAVAKAITNFLMEQRDDLVGMLRVLQV